MSVLLINFKSWIEPQCVWWVDLNWLPGAHQAAFSLTPFNWAQGESVMEESHELR